MMTTGFNPHPPSLAGEARGDASRPTSIRVSIHTRHHWRVKRKKMVRRCYCQAVSIHTRHHWRVKPATLGAIQRGDVVSIHTRHHWRVKPRSKYSPEIVQAVFQSTPAITGG